MKKHTVPLMGKVTPVISEDIWETPSEAIITYFPMPVALFFAGIILAAKRANQQKRIQRQKDIAELWGES